MSETTQKKKSLKPSSYRNLHNYMMKASDSWGNANIKTIGYGEIEDFLLEQGEKLSSETVANMKSCLHDFFQWLIKREVISQAPNFPPVKVHLSYRKVVGKQTQLAILDEIARIAPFKVWLGMSLFSIIDGNLFKHNDGFAHGKSLSGALPQTPRFKEA